MLGLRIRFAHFLAFALISFSTIIFANPITQSNRYTPNARHFSRARNAKSLVIDSVASASQYIHAPAKNKAMLWSGIEFNLAQNVAKQLGLQTLEQSVGPEILTHPDAHDTNKWVPFWGNLSEAFAEKVAHSGSSEIAIVLRAPKVTLTGPSDPLKDGRLWPKSDAAEIEIPRMRTTKMKIMAMHPDIAGPAGTDKYELYPNDQGFKWQQKWKKDNAIKPTAAAVKSTPTSGVGIKEKQR